MGFSGAGFTTCVLTTHIVRRYASTTCSVRNPAAALACCCQPSPASPLHARCRRHAGERSAAPFAAERDFRRRGRRLLPARSGVSTPRQRQRSLPPRPPPGRGYRIRRAPHLPRSASLACLLACCPRPSGCGIKPSPSSPLASVSGRLSGRLVLIDFQTPKPRRKKVPHTLTCKQARIEIGGASRGERKTPETGLLSDYGSCTTPQPASPPKPGCYLIMVHAPPHSQPAPRNRAVI